MDPSKATGLDCSIYVCRYLIKHPMSLGGGLSLSPGGKTIVFVPVRSLEANHGVVALRLYKGPSDFGSLEREVGFIQMKDLVPHSSSKYEKLSISTEPFRQNAHGVAHKAGGSNGFTYQRGDQFWLLDKHASKVEDGGSIAPVCNLRTSEYGTINVADVCWYPDVWGPAGDLWTVVGFLREIRGGRRGTSIRTICRVNQPVSLEKQVFGQAKVEGSSMAKEERKAVYLQKLQAIGKIIEREVQPPSGRLIPISMLLCPSTPPTSTRPPEVTSDGLSATRRSQSPQNSLQPSESEDDGKKDLSSRSTLRPYGCL